MEREKKHPPINQSPISFEGLNPNWSSSPEAKPKSNPKQDTLWRKFVKDNPDWRKKYGIAKDNPYWHKVEGDKSTSSSNPNSLWRKFVKDNPDWRKKYGISKDNSDWRKVYGDKTSSKSSPMAPSMTPPMSPPKSENSWFDNFVFLNDEHEALFKSFPEKKQQIIIKMAQKNPDKIHRILHAQLAKALKK